MPHARSLAIATIAGLWSCTSFEAAPASEAPRDGLVLAFDFEDATASTVADGSSFHNDGTLVEAKRTPGVHGQAVTFGAPAKSSVLVRSSPSLDIAGTELTLAFWAFIPPPAGTQDGVIVGKPWVTSEYLQPYYQYGVELSVNDTRGVKLFLGAEDGESPITLTVAVPFDAWVHIAFVVTSGTAIGYVDGVPVGSEAVRPIVQRGTPLFVGLDQLGRQPFVGSLDELRIYSRGLTPSEVLVLAKR
jgi:hypothetical protein